MKRADWMGVGITTGYQVMCGWRGKTWNVRSLRPVYKRLRQDWAWQAEGGPAAGCIWVAFHSLAFLLEYCSTWDEIGLRLCPEPQVTD